MVSDFAPRPAAAVHRGGAVLFETDVARLLTFLAAAGFMGLFPIFYFYHFLVNQGFIDAFLGGAWGAFTVLVVALMPPLVIVHGSCYPAVARPVYLLFLALVIYSLAWIALNNLAPSNPFLVEEANEQMLSAVLSWVALFVIGVYLKPDSPGLRITLAVCWVLVTIIALTASNQFIEGTQGVTLEETVAGYKEMARSATYLSIALVVFTRIIWVRAALSLATVVMLFFIGSRSELVGFLGAAALVEAIAVRRSVFGQSALFFTAAAATLWVANNIGLFATSREFALLDVSTDQSWNERELLMDLAWRQIVDSPVMGVYGGNFFNGGVGAYAHNALSAWVSLGLVGFILYVLINVYCFWISLSHAWRDTESLNWRIALMVNAISILFIIVSQGMFWTLPALGWGMTLRARALEHEQRTRIVARAALAAQ